MLAITVKQNSRFLAAGRMALLSEFGRAERGGAGRAWICQRTSSGGTGDRSAAERPRLARHRWSARPRRAAVRATV